MSGLESAEVLQNNQVGQDLWEIILLAPKTAAKGVPGQFVHLTVTPHQSSDPLLKRPISLYDINAEQGQITLLYKVVGRGTERMTLLTAHDQLPLLGPVGQGFNLTPPGAKVLLVGGGVGTAPLLYLARALKAAGREVTVINGAATKEQLAGEQRFSALGVQHLAVTLDGSFGVKGLVTDVMRIELEKNAYDFLYICGPEPMMAACAAIAAEYRLPGEASLEAFMGCAVGACLGCARKLKADDIGYVKVCKDGPVFNLAALEW